MCVHIYIYIYIYRERERYTYRTPLRHYILICFCLQRTQTQTTDTESESNLGIASCLFAHSRFLKCHRVVLGRDPGTLKSDIVSNKKTFTINLFGFETLKL